MFGSDAPLDRFAKEETRITSYNNFIEEIKAAIRNDNDLKADADKIIDDLFYNNAKKLYKLKTPKSYRELSKSEKVLNFMSKNIGKLSLGAIGAFAIAMGLCFHEDKVKKNKPHISLVG